MRVRQLEGERAQGCPKTLSPSLALPACPPQRPSPGPDALRNSSGLHSALAQGTICWPGEVCPHQCPTPNGTHLGTPSNAVRCCCCASLSPQEEHPCALHHFDQIAAAAAGKLVAVFLDYDGAPALARDWVWLAICPAVLSAVATAAQYCFSSIVRALAGTLTPIVANPDAALLSDQVRCALIYRAATACRPALHPWPLLRRPP